MDEPLSNLDAKLRTQVRAEIKALQQRTTTTTLYVTHDQVEAMTLGDRVAVLDHGVAAAGRAAARALRPARERVRRGLHRQPADEPRSRPGSTPMDGPLVSRGSAIRRRRPATAARARSACRSTGGVRPEAIAIVADDAATRFARPSPTSSSWATRRSSTPTSATCAPRRPDGRHGALSPG